MSHATKELFKIANNEHPNTYSHSPLYVTTQLFVSTQPIKSLRGKPDVPLFYSFHLLYESEARRKANFVKRRNIDIEKNHIYRTNS